MIARMAKVFVVARAADRDRLVNGLGALGVVHIEPVDAERAAPDEQTTAAIGSLDRAMQLLEDVEPVGDAPDLDPAEAAAEALRVHRDDAERRGRLASLHRQIEQLAVWGDVRLEQFRQLRDRGLTLWFYEVPPEEAGRIEAECTETVAEMADKLVLVAAVTRGDEPRVPESAVPVEWPSRDRPSLRAEAHEIDEKLKQSGRRLARLAHLTDAMREERDKLAAEAEYTTARRSGMTEGALYAVQGWVPADLGATGLTRGLADRGVEAAAEAIDPAEDEQPPTLIRYPRWARPIKALLDMLGTSPGYREFDPSPYFMVAMPIFAAMLVGDAGYGLIFTIIGLLAYGKLARSGAKETAQLVLVFSLATALWGVLTGNAFGVGPEKMVGAGGLWAAIGGTWEHVAVWWRPTDQAEEGRNLVMQIAFILGCVHLVLAHLQQAVMLLPDQRGVAEIGWMGFIFGMFTLVWLLFFDPLIPPMATLLILVGSFAVIALFTSPSRNPLKRIGFGVLGNLMGIPGAFGDMLSYIRLMAVGLASYYIAVAFNDLSMQLLEASMLALPLTILVLVLAHSLNIGLCLIAIFAHGVRLNMLEFSMNAGVQWVGHPYAPFSLKTAVNQGDR